MANQAYLDRPTVTAGPYVETLDLTEICGVCGDPADGVVCLFVTAENAVVSFCEEHGQPGARGCLEPIIDGLHCVDVHGHPGPHRRVRRG